MPDYRRANCRSCSGNREEVGPISWRGRCENCAIERMAANNLEISAGSGPFAEHRLRRQLMAAQRGLIALEREQG